MRVIYVAGPFRGANHFSIAENIRKAERVALSIWQLGAACICPHANTAHFQGAAPDHVWLEGDIELLRRSDAVMLVEGWEQSEGTQAEVAYAREHQIPVFWLLSELAMWLRAHP
jgi:nucleoside 2-deoxyribosyltransferase